MAQSDFRSFLHPIAATAEYKFHVEANKKTRKILVTLKMKIGLYFTDYEEAVKGMKMYRIHVFLLVLEKKVPFHLFCYDRHVFPLSRKEKENFPLMGVD